MGYSFLNMQENGTTPRISPVNDAKENEFPFVVYLVTEDGVQRCTGSLLERRWVLTAAHCLNRGLTHVYLGVYDKSINDSISKQVIAIAEEIPHPNYTFSPIKILSDIGLVRLASPANTRSEAISKVVPLESPSLKATFLTNKKKCLVLGWGLVRADFVWFQASKLQKLEIRFVNDSEATERGYKLFPPSILSTEAVYEDKCKVGSICNGDSGGPVVCKKGGRWVQVGLTSYYWEEDGCITGLKGTSDVEYGIAWVKSVIYG